MDYHSLHMKTVVELRKLARDAGLRVPAGTNKNTLIEMLLASEAAPQPAPKPETAEAAPKPRRGRSPKQAAEGSEAPEKPKPRRGRPPKQAAAPVEAPAADSAPAPAPEAVETPVVAAVEVPAPESPQASTPAETMPVEKTPVEPAPTTPAPTEPAPKPEAPDAPQGDGSEPRNGRAVTRERPFTSLRNNPRPMNDRPRFPTGNPGGGMRVPGPRFSRQGDNRVGGGPGWENRDNPRRPVLHTAQPQAEPSPAPAPERTRPDGGYIPDPRSVNPAVPEMLAAGECGDGAGVLELQPDGYGFLRAENCLPGPNDVYISIAQIRRFNLRNGDHVVGKTRAQREGDRYSAMMYITEVNGESPDKTIDRPRFEDLVPIYPDERLRLEPPEGHGDLSLRLIDMLAPIGKGQRGMIVSQPKAGKTTLLKKVANAITAQYPDVYLIVLLIDERPEEVTDMQRSIKGEVIYSTFDEAPENHARVSEMVLSRAQRLVEMGRDVVVLLDSITRLARAYNLTITPTGRSLSGGLDPGALFKPKRFFGAARNIENGGSLTIIATALVETGSRMDDIIFEEFKGTGNMELHLDRKLSDRRVFPAIDLLKSGTRREELLLSEDEMNGEYQVRKMLAGRQQEMYEQLIELMTKTATNMDFFSRLKGWLAVYEKGGYSLGR